MQRLRTTQRKVGSRYLSESAFHGVWCSAGPHFRAQTKNRHRQGGVSDHEEPHGFAKAELQRSSPASGRVKGKEESQITKSLIALSLLASATRDVPANPSPCLSHALHVECVRICDPWRRQLEGWKPNRLLMVRNLLSPHSTPDLSMVVSNKVLHALVEYDETVEQAERAVGTCRCSCSSPALVPKQAWLLPTGTEAPLV